MWTVSTLEYHPSVSTSYHHGNLREALVREAVALAREKGAPGVVLREVARRAGVSHNAAYRHFADREELLREVAEAGMDDLAAAMRARLSRRIGGTTEARARRRLREIGTAYVEFALAEPGLFGVAFSAHPTEEPAEEPAEVTLEPTGEGPYDLLGQALDGLVSAGIMTAERREGAEIVCWSAVHGFAMLHLDGPLRDVPAAERSVELERMLDLLERGLS
jgi:AcrR family transcriptional regulator